MSSIIHLVRKIEHGSCLSRQKLMRLSRVSSPSKHKGQIVWSVVWEICRKIWNMLMAMELVLLRWLVGSFYHITYWCRAALEDKLIFCIGASYAPFDSGIKWLSEYINDFLTVFRHMLLYPIHHVDLLAIRHLMIILLLLSHVLVILPSQILKSGALNMPSLLLKHVIHLRSV